MVKREITLKVIAMNYILSNCTTQCRDELSGETGCFIFDTGRYEETGKFFATSEVYPDLMSLYSNTKPEERKVDYVEFAR